MRIGLVTMLLLIASIGYAQDKQSDLQRIEQAVEPIGNGSYDRPFSLLYDKEKGSAFIKYNPVTLTFSGLMYMYQNVISPQISAGCLYAPSCSHFGKESIKEFGFIKGVFVTADRMMRCNRISAYDIHPLDIKSTNKAVDRASKYRVKHP